MIFLKIVLKTTPGIILFINILEYFFKENTNTSIFKIATYDKEYYIITNGGNLLYYKLLCIIVTAI